MLLTAAAVIVILAFWGLFEAYYDVYTTAGNQAETLTGRIGIWAYVFVAAIRKAMDRAWFRLHVEGHSSLRPRSV